MSSDTVWIPLFIVVATLLFFVSVSFIDFSSFSSPVSNDSVVDSGRLYNGSVVSDSCVFAYAGGNYSGMIRFNVSHMCTPK